jgi:hypothetical protein
VPDIYRMMKRQALLSGMLALVGACVVVKPGVLDAGGDDETGSNQDEGTPDEGSPDTGEEPDLPDPGPDPDPGPTDGDGCAEKLDILVVIDNSGSMGEEQTSLTGAFPSLIHGLDQAGVDWRLAVTTTDNSNIWCPEMTSSPESGRFVFSSCTTRLDDFVLGNDVDVKDLACNSVCNLEADQLEALPTTTADDPVAKPRPWLQREGGQLNLPDGIDAGEALRCLIPQGVNGCGFEQQLESMRLALARTSNANAPEGGFMRDDASLLVLLVSDETDCSVRPEHEEAVFSADGDRVFWTDPSASFPTSAVCWNAGIECSGDPSNYDDCVATNKNVMGQPSTPGQAVLFPVTRYTNTLEMIEDSKRAIDPGADVAVLAIAGVGADGTITYADVTDTDPTFQDSFGIGPGCTGPNPLDPGSPVTAVPPGRMREVAEQLSTEPFGSICGDDYEEFMLATLERFVGGC